MTLRRFGVFTAYALLASFLWILVMVAHDELQASEPGRVFIDVARWLFIPLYIIQALLMIVAIALRGGPPTKPDLLGVVTGYVVWILSIVPFCLIDWWRSRESGRS